jgi:predicted peptidase
MQKLNLILICAAMLTLTACRTNTFSADDSSAAQTAQKFSVTQTRTLAADYLLFLPAGYAANPEKKWPLILFLHGSGERGTNVFAVAKHGPPSVAPGMTNFPFIVVSPQCAPGQIWENDLLIALLDDVEKKYHVDTHRVYLTGLSMGGFGAWTLGLTYPERFAAMAPMCGGGDSITPDLATGARKEALKTLPIWAFHGAKDPVVPPMESVHMVDLMRELGDKDVKLTIYPDAGHNCWTRTYANAELFDWFLQHSR